jgi:hypothetical protein
MRDTIFIHTNDKQMLGALVSAYSMKRNSRHPDRFDVRIIRREDYPFFDAREGQEFLRGKDRRRWRNDDLQSFTPLRFMPPELMGYQGRAVVTDPDVFAAGDVGELLARDMGGKALMGVWRPGTSARHDYVASSVMLLDCAKLRHWRCEEQFNELFEDKRDYLKWVQLEYEPRESIGRLEPEWNHFDTLNENTKLLHNTKRRTQPWKTGLPVDYTVPERTLWGIARTDWAIGVVNAILGSASPLGRYKPHPDPRQEQFFFDLLRECVDKGMVREQQVRDAMARNHVRPDALDLIGRGDARAAA